MQYLITNILTWKFLEIFRNYKTSLNMRSKFNSLTVTTILSVIAFKNLLLFNYLTKVKQRVLTIFRIQD